MLHGLSLFVRRRRRTTTLICRLPLISPGSSAAALTLTRHVRSILRHQSARDCSERRCGGDSRGAARNRARRMRNEPPPRPIESKTITAELISAAPPQPVAAPVAIQSTPVPPPPKPVPPKPTPKPKPVVQPHVKAAPTPLPQTTAPSPRRGCRARARSCAARAAALPRRPLPAAPAIGRPTMAAERTEGRRASRMQHRDAGLSDAVAASRGIGHGGGEVRGRADGQDREHRTEEEQRFVAAR